MAIKKKDFQRTASLLRELLEKLPDDDGNDDDDDSLDTSLIRDSVQLLLLHMQTYYRNLQLKASTARPGPESEGDATSTRLSRTPRAREPVPSLPCVPDHFDWKWASVQGLKIKPDSLPVETGPLVLNTLPLFIQATKEGDTELIEQLILKEPESVGVTDKLGRTAAFYAIHYKQAGALSTLLENSIDIAHQANDQSTVIHQAVYDNQPAQLELLVKYCQDIRVLDSQDSLGRSPLHWATTLNDPACLQLLLKYGVDASVPDARGLTPSMWCCHFDSQPCLDLISAAAATPEAGIERDRLGRTWLHWAVRRQEPLNCLENLLTAETAAIGDSQGQTAVHLAAQQGALGACRAMVDRLGIQCAQRPDHQGRTCLHLATINGHGHLLHYLLSKGANLEVRDSNDASAWDYAKARNLNYCAMVLQSFKKKGSSEKGGGHSPKGGHLPRKGGPDNSQRDGEFQQSQQNEMNNNFGKQINEKQPLPFNPTPPPPKSNQILMPIETTQKFPENGGSIFGHSQMQEQNDEEDSIHYGDPEQAENEIQPAPEVNVYDEQGERLKQPYDARPLRDRSDSIISESSITGDMNVSDIEDEPESRRQNASSPSVIDHSAKPAAAKRQPQPLAQHTHPQQLGPLHMRGALDPITTSTNSKNNKKKHKHKNKTPRSNSPGSRTAPSPSAPPLEPVRGETYAGGLKPLAAPRSPSPYEGQPRAYQTHGVAWAGPLPAPPPTPPPPPGGVLPVGYPERVSSPLPPWEPDLINDQMEPAPPPPRIHKGGGNSSAKLHSIPMEQHSGNYHHQQQQQQQQQYPNGGGGLPYPESGGLQPHRGGAGIGGGGSGSGYPAAAQQGPVAREQGRALLNSQAIDQANSGGGRRAKPPHPFNRPPPAQYHMTTTTLRNNAYT